MPHCDDDEDGWDAFASLGHPMNSSSSDEFSDAESLDLRGVRILVVEDSWQLAMALKSLLLALGAEVSGPVATAADAERLAIEQPPDAALVDFNLRGGERADVLIERLHQQGVYVIVTSGYAVLPVVPRNAAAILQKPISEMALLGSLRPVVARKAQGRPEAS
jgi:DNA-binding response OmpR family regulator